MFPAVRGATVRDAGRARGSADREAWSQRRVRSFEKATGGSVEAVPGARDAPAQRADGWQSVSDNPATERSVSGQPVYAAQAYAAGAAGMARLPALGRSTAGELPWWWPKDLPAPHPKNPTPIERPPPPDDSDWEQRFSTQYNRNYWVNKLTRKTTWRDPRPLPAFPPPLTPQEPGSLLANAASAPAAAFVRPAGAYTPPPKVKLTVPSGPFVAPAPISPEVRQKAMQQADSPFALLAAAVRQNEDVFPSSGSRSSATKPAQKRNVIANMYKTRGALLTGLRTGKLEEAVEKMERDTAADEASPASPAAPEPKPEAAAERAEEPAKSQPGAEPAKPEQSDPAAEPAAEPAKPDTEPAAQPAKPNPSDPAAERAEEPAKSQPAAEPAKPERSDPAAEPVAKPVKPDTEPAAQPAKPNPSDPAAEPVAEPAMSEQQPAADPATPDPDPAA